MTYRPRLFPLAVALAALIPAAACSPFHVPSPDDCTTRSQNEYVYDVLDQVYLWNHELPARASIDFGAYEEPGDLLRELRYSEHDRWSYIAEKVVSDALFEEGKFIGYGFSYKRVGDGPVRVSFVNAGSPADRAGIVRGDEFVSINAYNIAEIDKNEMWGEIFGPKDLGVESTIEIRGKDGQLREVTLTREWVDIITVPIARVLDDGSGPVGYVHFSSFVGQAADELDDAWDTFNEANIRSLIVDLRYNGGGSLSIARHLIDLIAGAHTNGDGIAYRLEYNQDLADENEEFGMRDPSRSIDLDHVVFITTRRSLSASEVVINAVRAHMPVSIVGDTTGGKPVGSKRYEFCDQILFPITFRVRNADGVSDYFDGIPADCPEIDDLDHELGDSQEAGVAAGLALVRGKPCPAMGDVEPGADDSAMFADDPLAHLLWMR